MINFDSTAYKLPPLNKKELESYFNRLKISTNHLEGIECNFPTLQRLHFLHPQSIPFENLDSYCDQVPSLNPTDVFNKLVVNARGGYCFEHNQLFARVLKSLGFQVQGLRARVLWQQPEDCIPPKTHQALLVRSPRQNDEFYLVDVGFGGLTMTAPILLNETNAQQTPNELLRISPTVNSKDPNKFLLCARINQNWQPIYSFSLDASSTSDYVQANCYVATWPQSRFVNHIIVSRVMKKKRYALLDKKLKIYQDGMLEHTEIFANADALCQCLQDIFGIDLRTRLSLKETSLTT